MRSAQPFFLTCVPHKHVRAAGCVCVCFRADGKHVLLKQCHSFDWIMDMIDLVAPDLPTTGTSSPQPPTPTSPPGAVRYVAPDQHLLYFLPSANAPVTLRCVLGHVLRLSPLVVPGGCCCVGSRGPSFTARRQLGRGLPLAGGITPGTLCAIVAE